MALVTDRSLFIHVQKCGGMSVRQAMRLCRGPCYESGPVEVERHFGLPELLTAHPGIDNGRYSFGFVRHPIPWLRSRWAWAVESALPAQARHRPAAAALWMTACWSDDFRVFVERTLERYPGIATQTMFRMLGLWGPRPVDFIGRVENLVDDICLALRNAGEDFDEANLRSLRPSNRSATKTEPLPRSLELAILKAEAPLVERFYAM